uniref:Uncharacterized protein n=1 Tax=Anopheles farauti TaxID=69004 RepID=A0A182QAJ4_9DIPT
MPMIAPTITCDSSRICVSVWSRMIVIMVRLSSIQNCIQPDVGKPACFFGTVMLTLSVESSRDVVQVALQPVCVWAVCPGRGTTAVPNSGPVASAAGFPSVASVVAVVDAVVVMGAVWAAEAVRVEAPVDSVPAPGMSFRSVLGVSRIVIARTFEPERGQERDQPVHAPLINALPLGQHVQIVKQLEYPGRRLVDGADDRATAAGQRLQQRDQLRAGRAVQAARRLVEEHHRRVVHELQGDRQPLPLAAGEIERERGGRIEQPERFDDLLHDGPLRRHGDVLAELQIGRHHHRLAHGQIRQQPVVLHDVAGQLAELAQIPILAVDQHRTAEIVVPSTVSSRSSRLLHPDGGSAPSRKSPPPPVGDIGRIQTTAGRLR